MDVICAWYHKDPRKLAVKPGSGTSYGICPECRERFEKEVDDYVEKLVHRHDQAPDSSVSCP